MTAGNLKFEALQLAIQSYLERFPRLTVKALSMRTGVPYATLRRIIQSEVNDIKDETIFRIIDRVLTKAEQLEFIREHYPVLSRIMSEQAPAEASHEDISRQFKTFHRMNPHNMILQLVQSKAGTLRTDIERLTGEYGLMALDEMIGVGLLHEEQGVIEIRMKHELDFDDVRYQVSKDLDSIPNLLHGAPGLIHHVLGAVTPEGLLQLMKKSRTLLNEVEEVMADGRGKIPFFFDIVLGVYDPERVPIRCKDDNGT